MTSFRILLAGLLVTCGVGCSDESDDARQSPATQPAGDTTMRADSRFVDDYLTKWDQFAQGDNALVPYLRGNKSRFESSLAQLFRSRDRGAPARLVFYAVVQVGGAIPADSELAASAIEVLGGDFPVMTTEDGDGKLFAADLYSWWEAHEGEFEHFKTFDEWLRRDFAQKTVLPMYKNLQRRPK